MEELAGGGKEEPVDSSAHHPMTGVDSDTTQFVGRDGSYERFY